MTECVLCSFELSEQSLTFDKDPRKYHLCSSCKIIQVHPSFFPSFEESKNRYEQHKNDAGSEGHILHLKKALELSKTYLNQESICLDYGCGPKPILSGLLKKNGFHCENYDPYFGFDIDDDKKYDHIFCLETAEHFFNPAFEFESIFNKLSSGGRLTLMTERYEDIGQFAHWYYKRDFTHVIFFHFETLRYLEKNMGASIVYDDGKCVTIFQKK